MNMNNVKPRVLLVIGLFAIALRTLLQTMVDRAHRTTGMTDFLLGIVLGIGIGLIGIAIWRMRRPHHFV